MATVGRIVRPHGHKGGVVVEPETDFAAERFAPGAQVHWRRDEQMTAAAVAASRQFRGRWIVMFEGVLTMNDAEALRGLELRIPAEALRPLTPGFHYVHDLAGCRVVTPAGTEVGRVARVDLAGGTPLLAVVDDAGEEVLVPLAEAICREISPESKRIVVDLPEGLLDLNRRRGR